MSVFKRRGQSSLNAVLHRSEPTEWQKFWNGPTVYLATKLYEWRRIIRFQPISPITMVCISDIHNSQPMVPPGDILIHAGDLTQSGSFHELQSGLDWLNTFSHEHKIVIGGNHDLVLDPTFRKKQAAAGDRVEGIKWGDLIYLNNESVTIHCSAGRELKVFGSPMTSQHGNWAFQYSRAQDVWRDLVPLDTDILVSHGPPKAHLDLGNLGCNSLLREIWRRKPRLHVFGHIHAGYGQEWLLFDGLQQTYEAILDARGGVFRLGQVLYQYCLAYFRTPRECHTVLVNAAIVGGFRDEKNRQAVVVHL